MMNHFMKLPIPEEEIIRNILNIQNSMQHVTIKVLQNYLFSKRSTIRIPTSETPNAHNSQNSHGFRINLP